MNRPTIDDATDEEIDAFLDAIAELDADDEDNAAMPWWLGLALYIIGIVAGFVAGRLT